MNRGQQQIAPASAPPTAGQYLACQLSQQEYGIIILRVREILAMVPVTALPRTPEHVAGVVNLRGRIVPVVDLRKKLGVAAVEPGRRSCIVVVDCSDEADGSHLVGCIVDAVREVLEVSPEQLEPTPRGVRGTDDCIAGLAKLSDRVVILVDIPHLLADIDPGALLGPKLHD